MHHPDSADIQSCAWRTFSLRPLPVSAETCIFARVRGEAKSATLARGQKSVIQNVSLCAQSSHQKTRAQTLTRLFECLADVIRSERTRRKKKRKKKRTKLGGWEIKSPAAHAWCHVTLNRSTKTGFQTLFFCPALRTPRFSRLSAQIITATDSTRLTSPDSSTIQLSTWVGCRCVYWAPACPC